MWGDPKEEVQLRGTQPYGLARGRFFRTFNSPIPPNSPTQLPTLARVMSPQSPQHTYYLPARSLFPPLSDTKNYCGAGGWNYPCFSGSTGPHLFPMEPDLRILSCSCSCFPRDQKSLDSGQKLRASHRSLEALQEVLFQKGIDILVEKSIPHGAKSEFRARVFVTLRGEWDYHHHPQCPDG